MSFVVKQQSFEGPLDVLLSLIEKRKLFINDISLAKVADDYIAHIKTFEHFPIGDSANFILIASTLLLIKSKSLLPHLPLTDEEQGNIEDLELRLKIYACIKNAGVHIKERFGKHIIFGKSTNRIVTPVFSPDQSMTVGNIFTTIKTVLNNLPKKEYIPKAIVQKVISLEEMIGTLTARIKSSLKMSFNDFANVSKAEKVNVIVSFLAMLELFKQGVIVVSQETHKGEIMIETKEVGVPRYE